LRSCDNEPLALSRFISQRTPTERAKPLHGTCNRFLTFAGTHVSPSMPLQKKSSVELSKRRGNSIITLSTRKKRGAALSPAGVFAIAAFVEKPDAATAAQYVASGEYLWNSGIFVWRTTVILDAFKEFMPGLYKMVQKAEKAGLSAAAINSFYNGCEKESIDYGIMEQSRKVTAVVGSFEWDDIGSWEYVSRVYGKNEKNTTVVGPHIFQKDCSDSVVVNHSAYTIAAVGLDDTVVVATADALMVIKRSRWAGASAICMIIEVVSHFSALSLKAP